ncbi:DNA polymerase III subunit delta' [Microbulbifer sp. CAU 1566]|uniref:DNA polymerase III subunit delta' n=1 Tax=unclassified Microbulbifer TaxID=2619833 RepID=UPI0013594C55|nr:MULTISPECIES: DNA polymerase III subunit delta' [unclassified Microbulbifer]MCK7596884.1 DNA polymerase III subunit delta' [Microbulbifer sp. CAU 1566]
MSKAKAKSPKGQEEVPVAEPQLPIPSPLPWQASQWQRLGAQWIAGRCPHALLISGQPGLGKRRFADAFAALLLCDQPRHGLACGECRGCQLRIARSHPDFIRVVPEKEQGPLKVEQIRQLGEFVGRTSAREGARVVWLAPAEAMNINAANALLKNLEEPSGSVIFLLITDNPSGLLPTIRSRCQTIAFPVPPQQAALRWLSDSGVEGDQATSALNLAGGAPLLAVNLMEPESRELREQFLRDLTTLSRGNESPVTLAGRWESPGEGVDLNLLLQFWQSWLAQMLKVRSTDQPADREIMALLQRLPGNGHEGLRPLFGFYDQLLKARGLLAGNSNPNKRLLMEELLIRWAALFR